MAFSERELSAAMAAAGRPVSLLTLVEWRRCGLMPGVVSRSLGHKKGKVWYWSDDNTFERAVLIYDLLRDRVKRPELYWLMWLCGLSVPLEQLRRAWSHKSRVCDPGRSIMVDGAPSGLDEVARPVFFDAAGGGSRERNVPTYPLLDIALTACAFLEESKNPEIDLLIDAIDSELAARPGRPRLELHTQGRQMVLMAKAIWSAIKTSDMISHATDTELLEAQTYTTTALKYFQRRSQQSSNARETSRYAGSWPIDEAGKFGTPLFFLVLILLKSGQRAVLERFVREFANGRKFVLPGPQLEDRAQLRAQPITI